MNRAAWIAGGALLLALAYAARRMPWPVAGAVITSGFKTPDRPTHNGVDIRAAVGTPILAPFAGVVTERYTHERGGRSLVVHLDNGLRAGFAHLSEWVASVGDRFRAGDLLGYTGNTGTTTGPHLHYTLSRDGMPLDPETLSA